MDPGIHYSCKRMLTAADYVHSIVLQSSYKTVQVKRECRTTPKVTVSTNPHKRICLLKEVVLQRNDNALERPLSSVSGLFPDVVGYSGDIACIKSSINLIQHEERRRLVGVDGEEQR